MLMAGCLAAAETAMSDEELPVSSYELLRHLVTAGVVYLFEGEVVRGGEHHHRVVH